MQDPLRRLRARHVAHTAAAGIFAERPLDPGRRKQRNKRPDNDQNISRIPPSIITEVTGKELRVQTADGILSLLEVQLEGKKRMDTEAFLRGYKAAAGMRLS